MDRDSKATLHRRNVPEADKMTTEGRLEDLVRAFKVPSKRYSAGIHHSGREVAPVWPDTLSGCDLSRPDLAW
jgi:hypothetical protein